MISLIVAYANNQVIGNKGAYYGKIAKSLQEAIKIAGDRDIYISGDARMYEEALYKRN